MKHTALLRGSRLFSVTAAAQQAKLTAPQLYDGMVKRGIDTFYGVPDSLLKDFAMYVSDRHATEEVEKHIIAANEATAVGLAAGHFMATGSPSCVYLQNSGLGNIVNPVMSMAHQEIYGIPMLLLIGWRGEPGVKDEPQHTFMGAQSEAVLDSMKVPHTVLPDNLEDAEACLDEVSEYMTANQAPFAVLVRKGTFEKYKLQANLVPAGPTMSRENAIKAVADALGNQVAIVSATGMPSRELYEHRVEQFGVEGATGRDFLTVGSMGCCSSIAMGLAFGAPGKQIVCLDGDGGTIMHAGALITAGQKGPKNFKHVIVNNGAHDSVGGQPTYAFDFELTEVAQSAGYKGVKVVSTPEEIKAGCEWLLQEEGPVLLEVRTTTGSRSDLGRPKSTPQENKTAFMKFVANL